MNRIFRINVHPETSSPLAGEGWGVKKKFGNFQTMITPTLPSPVRGRGKAGCKNDYNDPLDCR